MLTPIGPADVTNNSTVYSDDLQDNLSHDAYAVLIFAEIHAGHNSKQDAVGKLKVYAVNDRQQFAFYIGTHFYNGEYWDVNSLNMWLPISSDRFPFTEVMGEPAVGHALCFLNIAVYY